MAPHPSSVGSDGGGTYLGGHPGRDASLEPVGTADLEVAWSIGQAFPDQDFSIVDRTGLAVRERLGVLRAATFDADFAVYRFGLRRERAFKIAG